MNELPIDWSDQIQKVYPKRSGPSGWKGMKLMLALRRALINSTWDEILNGCENYKTYCTQAGIEGSTFVQNPIRFIEEGSYEEEFIYRAPKSKDDIAREQIAANEGLRWAKAKAAGKSLRCPITPMLKESVGSFETRVRLLENDHGYGSGAVAGSGGENAERDRISAERLSGRISQLVGNMRAVKT